MLGAFFWRGRIPKAFLREENQKFSSCRGFSTLGICRASRSQGFGKAGGGGSDELPAPGCDTALEFCLKNKIIIIIIIK